VGWAALSEFVPLYPLYALLFLEHGLTTADLSALFAVWSVTALLAEVPAGALADRWSRRGALVCGAGLQAAAFAVWAAVPGTAAFAAGFALWGVSSALYSGTAEALIYDGLRAVGAEAAFARVNGRMTAVELLAQLPTAVAATALYALGGFSLVAWVSAVSSLAAGVLALRFPEPPRDRTAALLATLWAGAAQVVRHPPLRLAVGAVALVGGLDAMEEYFPVLAADRGVPTGAVPFVVLVVSLAGAAGAALGERADRLRDGGLPALLALAGLLLGAVALLPGPAALAALAVAYGLYLAVLVASEARLQERIDGPYRATVTSVAGLGIELAGLLVFAVWALGGGTATALLVLAVVPVVAGGLRARPGRGDREPREQGLHQRADRQRVDDGHDAERAAQQPAGDDDGHLDRRPHEPHRPAGAPDEPGHQPVPGARAHAHTHVGGGRDGVEDHAGDGVRDPHGQR
jgi:MFS family permease